MTEAEKEILATRDRRREERAALRRLIAIGNLMALRLSLIADELDQSSSQDAERLERTLPESWDAVLEKFRETQS